MAGNKDWLPTRLADQATVFENLGSKIGTYAGVLELSPPQQADIEKLCTEFDVAYTQTEGCRAAMLATVTWRDQIFKGQPQGSGAPDPPVFPQTTLPSGSSIGMMQQIRDWRDIILASRGYTEAIGQDLMIVGGGNGTGPNIPVGDAVPTIKCQPGAGYEVDISGPMHGMDAMRIEWQANGSSTWSLVGFLTKTPGHVIISVPTPGEPVSGRLRARYIHNNDPVGDYSQEAAVTVSA